MTSRVIHSADDLPALGEALRRLDYAQPWQVSWRPFEEARTDKQNRRYWGAIVASLQEWLAAKEGFTRDREVLHEWLKTEYFGQRVEQVQGRMLMMPRHSRTLTRRQFAEYVDACEARIIELGVPAEMIAGMSE